MFSSLGGFDRGTKTEGWIRHILSCPPSLTMFSSKCVRINEQFLSPNCWRRQPSKCVRKLSMNYIPIKCTKNLVYLHDNKNNRMFRYVDLTRWFPINKQPINCLNLRNFLLETFVEFFSFSCCVLSLPVLLQRRRRLPLPSSSIWAICPRNRVAQQNIKTEKKLFFA